MSAHQIIAKPNEPGVIGQFALLAVGGKTYYANCLDQIAGTTKPKRFRIQTGDKQGDVVGLGEYDLLYWAKDEEDP